MNTTTTIEAADDLIDVEMDNAMRLRGGKSTMGPRMASQREESSLGASDAGGPNLPALWVRGQEEVI